MSMANEQQRLAVLHASGLLDSAPDARLDRVIELTSSIFDVPVALVSLVDKDRQWFKSNHGLRHVSETPREVAFCSHTIESKDVMVVENAEADARFSKNPLVTGQPEIRFYAGAPLVMRSKYPIGTLCLIDFKPREFSQDDAKRLAKFGEVVVGILETQAAARLAQLDLEDDTPDQSHTDYVI